MLTKPYIYFFTSTLLKARVCMYAREADLRRDYKSHGFAVWSLCSFVLASKFKVIIKQRWMCKQ